MAQKTTLQPTGLPGKLRSFLAKAVSALSHVHIFSTANVSPNHVADSGNNVLIKGDTEVQGTSWMGGAANYTKIDREGVHSRIAQQPTAIDTAQTLTAAHDIVLCGSGNETFTLTLPTVASVVTGKMYSVKNIGTGLITLDGNGAETIDGDATQPVADAECLRVVSDGTEWWAI
ncbi:hypothetical protein KAR91_20775 [Candidatus Pacearchaeota archaeon]|nr:hypothetical protein [Candidatus Pacearchaeota archaeon]